jgi:hypothetical protein
MNIEVREKRAIDAFNPSLFFILAFGASLGYSTVCFKEVLWECACARCVTNAPERGFLDDVATHIGLFNG